MSNHKNEFENEIVSVLVTVFPLFPKAYARMLLYGIKNKFDMQDKMNLTAIVVNYNTKVIKITDTLNKAEYKFDFSEFVCINFESLKNIINK